MIDTADLFGLLTRSVWFTVTEEHLKLLRHLLVYWNVGEGYGGPAISCKRPYGNSAVPEDVAEILELPDSEWSGRRKRWFLALTTSPSATST